MSYKGKKPPQRRFDKKQKTKAYRFIIPKNRLEAVLKKKPAEWSQQHFFELIAYHILNTKEKLNPYPVQENTTVQVILPEEVLEKLHARVEEFGFKNLTEMFIRYSAELKTFKKKQQEQQQ